MKIHIAKRDPNLSDDTFMKNEKIGYLSQSARGKKPIGWNAEIGHQVWVHEVGYGITKHGTIKNKVINTIPSNDFNSLIKLYCSDKTKIKDSVYWWALIEKMMEKPNKDLIYVEFEVEYTYLKEPIPCSFKFQGGWKTLNKKEDLMKFETDKKESFLDISVTNKDIEALKNIPTKIKVEIFNIMRLSTNDKLVIDFDHIIPKSVGGLGYFIENVQPIPKAVNRSKNNSIPLVLFKVAKEYDSLDKIVSAYQKLKSNKEDEFSSEKKIFNYAEKIMKVTHRWSTEEQRKFYGKILEKYDKSYFMKLLNHQNG